MAEALAVMQGLLGGALALAGALMVVAGSAGVLRFPDIYTRTHAASVTDTLGATLMLAGLGLLADGPQTALKLVLVWAFMLLATPAAANALVHAAWTSRLAPWSRRTADGDDDASAAPPAGAGEAAP
jgi:multicomponent Na+:H+ antiporter subunit G